ncbi:hyaluronan/mRNA-binding family protein [Toxoplasma gondii VAND]|uniref:Hyaluronan/mRNA-binding family protein n=5 Tax=Toxoplasma gondii TaxID=5811 RepID=A0A086PU67_TOXGO|nr:hyaluronan/mRNA-binding family protein [Toxoplasma gondii p89]KFH03899.1 hyaluronan/mRNA-binding family protein [Toxoplasma gondii MAS]KFH05424.1 hyaluronan/mRNA-binding family protein [Toxoplasma gondii VAND]PUA83752.1 hyaluronan/mRNA-binding family protein [Toxoplasma gondii TgCATBr9]RQX69520.1 hyaluronan/mRNA-binding family protein [Toxoplasma gondii CAST]
MAPQRKYYTVGVSNKFSAFADNDSEGGDSSGEEDVILSSPPVPTAETQSTGKQLSGTNAGSAAGKKANEGVSAHHDSERRPRASAGGRYGREDQSAANAYRQGEFGGRGRGGQRGRFPRRNFVQGEENEENVEQTFGVRRGNFRGGRGRGGFYSRGRGGVQGDRHTAAAMGGRDPKKGGGGAHNWGDDERVAAAGEQEVEKTEEEKEKRQDSEEAEEEKKGGEEDVEEEKKDEEVLDLEAYKKMLEGKRQNLPNFIKKSNKKITTDQELEAQGYTLHVKEGREEEEEETASEEEDEHAEPKKKTMNVFEYIHNGGGRVNLFPSRRRGRGGAGPSGSREFRGGRGRGRGGSFVKSRDAPDIQDERAFPTLGGR